MLSEDYHANLRSDPTVMTVCEIDPLADPSWEAFIARHPRASVFHSPAWLRALRDAYDYQSVVYTSSRQGNDLENAIVFCKVESWLTGHRLVSLPFSDHCEPLVTDSNQLTQMTLELKGKMKLCKWKYIEIRPLSAVPAYDTGLGASCQYSFHSLDISSSKGDLFHKFHKNCVQRKIRRAERESLEYEEGNSENLLRQFYCLLVMTRKRQLLPPQPLTWFRALICSFGHNLKIRVASKNGAPIASILTLLHKDVMTYKYGCSDARFNNLGGTPMLFWKAIQDAKEAGCVKFDLGRSNLNNEGLIKFKEHWGTVRSELNYWRYPCAPGPAGDSWSLRVMKKMVAHSPDYPLIAAGRLLHPHIG